MNIPDHISESLETIFVLKYLNSLVQMRIRDTGIFFSLDPGSGMEKIRIRSKHPGSATLVSTCSFEKSGIYCTCCVPTKAPDIHCLLSNNIISYTNLAWHSKAFAYEKYRTFQLVSHLNKFVWNLQKWFFSKFILRRVISNDADFVKIFLHVKIDKTSTSFVLNNNKEVHHVFRCTGVQRAAFVSRSSQTTDTSPGIEKLSH